MSSSIFAKLRIPLGLALLVVGAVLALPFARPYLYLGVAKSVDEGAYPLNKQEVIRTVDNKTVAVKGKLFIPAVKMSENMIEGVDDYLNYGIGHYPETAWPGEGGNVVLTGHNTYARTPLLSLLHLVKKGARVVIHYHGKRYVYKVASRYLVEPDQIGKYRRAKGDQLTMITCYPPGYTAERLVLIARPYVDH